MRDHTAGTEQQGPRSAPFHGWTWVPAESCISDELLGNRLKAFTGIAMS